MPSSSKRLVDNGAFHVKIELRKKGFRLDPEPLLTSTFEIFSTPTFAFFCARGRGCFGTCAFLTTLSLSSLNRRDSSSRYPGHSFAALRHCEHAGSSWSHYKMVSHVWCRLEAIRWLKSDMPWSSSLCNWCSLCLAYCKKPSRYLCGSPFSAIRIEFADLIESSIPLVVVGNWPRHKHRYGHRHTRRTGDFKIDYRIWDMDDFEESAHSLVTFPRLYENGCFVQASTSTNASGGSERLATRHVLMR